jgi:hypothetical protein
MVITATINDLHLAKLSQPRTVTVKGIQIALIGADEKARSSVFSNWDPDSNRTDLMRRCRAKLDFPIIETSQRIRID